MAEGSLARNGMHELAQLLAPHSSLLFLTGAGISTASGIPDYRDSDGVRRGRAPIQGPEFRSSELVRKRYWARAMVGWRLLAKATPNAGHHAIAALEGSGRHTAIVTQNVDGLHHMAGSPHVVELHGNIHRVVCLDCGARHQRHLIQSQLERHNPDLLNASALPAPDGDAHLEPQALAHFVLPQCPACAGTLQPDVVFFGDGVPRARTEEAEQAVHHADAVLVVGSSLMVHSGYRLCKLAAEAGKPVVAINIGKTRADALLSLKVEQRSEQALPLLATLLRKMGGARQSLVTD